MTPFVPRQIPVQILGIASANDKELRETSDLERRKGESY